MACLSEVVGGSCLFNGWSWQPCPVLLFVQWLPIGAVARAHFLCVLSRIVQPDQVCVLQTLMHKAFWVMT